MMEQSVLGRDIKYQMSLIRRNAGESNEHLASRLYHAQMEVLSANAGRDLISDDPADPFQFHNLAVATRDAWITLASNVDPESGGQE